MPFPPDPDWQRNTTHPSSSALLAFLEADLDRGMCLAWAIESEPDPTRRTALLPEYETIALEVVRWIDRARQRNLPLGHLAGRVDQFREALTTARRQAGQ
jgi:hypothetical protein